MNDWATFTQFVPWYLDRDAIVEVSAARIGAPLRTAVAELFPPLHRLLSQAKVTSITINEAKYELLAWDSAQGDRCGWLCPLASEAPPDNVYDDHKSLLACFGGVVERFNEPEETWLLNLNDALTAREATHDASFIREYQWAFNDVGLSVPIKLSEYYSIAREANGNTTLCHRIRGELLMFAPDHSFDHLNVLEGCPEYTLYTINSAPTFRDWVNEVACQWLSHVAKS